MNVGTQLSLSVKLKLKLFTLRSIKHLSIYLSIYPLLSSTVLLCSRCLSGCVLWLCIRYRGLDSRCLVSWLLKGIISCWWGEATDVYLHKADVVYRRESCCFRGRQGGSGWVLSPKQRKMSLTVMQWTKVTICNHFYFGWIRGFSTAVNEKPLF